MTVMYDSVHPDNIPADAVAVAGYIDGRVSQWPQAGWDKWAHLPALHISVLADPSADTFDIEDGNASAADVAQAVAQRLVAGKWSVIYTSRDNVPAVQRALAVKSIRLQNAGAWPAPGAYLWVADWTQELHTSYQGQPVQPVAVQSLTNGQYDTSALAPGFLVGTEAPPAPQAPVPAPPDHPETHSTPIGTHGLHGFLATIPVGATGEGFAVYDGGAGTVPGATSLVPAVPWDTFVAATPWGPDPVVDADWGPIALDVQERGGYLFLHARNAPVHDPAASEVVARVVVTT